MVFGFGAWRCPCVTRALVTGTNCCVGIIWDSQFTLYVSLTIMLSVHLPDILWTPDTKLARWAWLLVSTSTIHGNVVCPNFESVYVLLETVKKKCHE